MTWLLKHRYRLRLLRMAGDGYEMLCPFGGQKMVLIDGVIAVGEAEETPEEQDHGAEPSPSMNNPQILDSPLEPIVDPTS